MNKIEIDELNEMREQLATLKKRLESQEIVNDRLIKETMTRKITSLNRSAIFLSVVCLIFIPVGYASFHNLGMSNAFCISTSCIFVFCLIGQFYAHYSLRTSDVMNGDLVSTYKAAARLRKIYKMWHYVSIPILIVWFAWMEYEIYNNIAQQDLTMMLIITASGIFGGIIGGIIGLRIHKKNLRSAEDIMRQIEELQQMQ